MSLKESRSKGQWVQSDATVVSHAQAGAPDVYKLVLRAPEIARRAVAGQFVEVRVGSGLDPLLRRPFSICEILPDGISVIYRVVGKGTAALAGVAPGAVLDVMGPLGHSFPDPAAGQGRLVLVGGGLGIPPMVAAAARAVSVGRDVVAVVGARTVEYLAGVEELAALGVPIIALTEDDSGEVQGRVTDPLPALLVHAGEVWACGPEPMLQAIKRLCVPIGTPCFVSVERHMACGFGIRIGCTVPKAGGGGYLKACQDGPVFAAEEVELNG